MSTLAEIAAYITGKCGRTDAASVTKAKEFVNNAYEFIWDYFAWRDLKVLDTVAVSADAQLVSLPADCGVVLALRWGDDRELTGHEMEEILRMNPEDWDQAGDPFGWSPAGKDGSGNVQVRLMRKTTTAETLHVLYKKKFTPLADADEPEISGINTALRAFGEAEFQEHHRKYATAERLSTKGGAMLTTKEDEERQQWGVTQRLVPEDGGWNGNDWEA